MPVRDQEYKSRWLRLLDKPKVKPEFKFKVEFKLALSVFPTSVLLLAMSEAIDKHEMLFLGTSALVTAACFLMLAIRSIPAWREIRRMEDRSIELGRPVNSEKLPKREHADAVP